MASRIPRNSGSQAQRKFKEGDLVRVLRGRDSGKEKRVVSAFGATVTLDDYDTIHPSNIALVKRA